MRQHPHQHQKMGKDSEAAACTANIQDVAALKLAA